VIQNQYFAQSIINTMKHLKIVNFTPKGISFMGGLTFDLPLLTDTPLDFSYVNSIVAFDWNARGADYRSINKPDNFEIFSADSHDDSPGVALRYFTKKYGIEPSNPRLVFFLMTIQTNMIYSKLLELAGTDEVEALRTAALRISTPALTGKMQFE
jgi:hypothetical protein